MTTPTETAVIVAVPEAEPVVGRHRRALDHSATWGVPAHVTVLYPFVSPAQITASVLAELAAAVTSVPAFECVFDRVCWFGEDAAWLAPNPHEPFRALTFAVWAAFPTCPPYRGEHPDPVPHLTIGSTRAAEAPQLRRAAQEVPADLPVRAHIDRARLMAGTDAPDSWRTLAEFPLMLK